MALVTAVVDRQRWSHDVSILIAAGAGVGRCVGSQPRSKVSMTIMRAAASMPVLRQHAGLVDRCFGRLWFFWARRHGEQLARVGNVCGSGAGGGQAIRPGGSEAP